MGLDHDLLPSALERVSYCAAQFRIGSIQIEVIDPLPLRKIEQFLCHSTVVLGKPLAAHADLADEQSRVAQFPVTHLFTPLNSFQTNSP